MLHRHYDAALADIADKYDRYRRVAGTRPEVAKQLEAMRAKDARKFFLRSGGAALSAAEAQEAIRTLIEQNGGRLVTMQAPTSREEGRYRQVSVNVQLAANVFALRKILHAIENHTPFLFIDNLQVRTQVPFNFRPAPGAEPEMYVTFDASGYALTGS
jgi:general secretion pathway protein M